MFQYSNKGSSFGLEKANAGENFIIGMNIFFFHGILFRGQKVRACFFLSINGNMSL